jgi:trimeric autotransporter adhesin
MIGFLKLPRVAIPARVVAWMFLALPTVGAHATTFTVTSSDDTAGTTCAANCTLRQAITAANADANPASTINFHIPQAKVHRIKIDTALPNVDHPTTINGYSQIDSQPNTLISGDDRVIKIELTPNSNSAKDLGLYITADNCTVKGLAIFGFTTGIRIGSSAANTAYNATISGNFIGLPADGTTDVGTFGGSGILVNAANNSTIGGTSPAARNVIANYFGGVRSFSTNTTNVPMDVMVVNNYIGTDAQGVLDRSNVVGILISDGASGWTVGLDAAPNLIAHSLIEGLQLYGSSTKNRFFANDFVGNAGQGIDLIPNNVTGKTPNDPDDGDTGPNNLQNFPVLSAASQEYDSLLLNATLDVPHTSVVTLQTFTIGVYASSVCNASGNGPGELYLGNRPAGVIDGGSVKNEGFSISLPAHPPHLSQITTTATDSAGNTSEFSNCVTVQPGNGIFKNGFEPEF